MSLHRMLMARAAEAKPLRIGVIGAGKFGSMYLSQIPTTPGIHLLGIADLSPDRARENLARLGWKPDVTAATSFADARQHGSTYLTDDWRALVSHPEIDIVVESTGDPIAAVEHALEAFRNGKHVVMVTVEADAFCGPLLARRAAQARAILGNHADRCGGGLPFDSGRGFAAPAGERCGHPRKQRDPAAAGMIGNTQPRLVPAQQRPVRTGTAFRACAAVGAPRRKSCGRCVIFGLDCLRCEFLREGDL